MPEDTEDQEREEQDSENEGSGGGSAAAQQLVDGIVSAAIAACNHPDKGQSPPSNVTQYLPYVLTALAEQNISDKENLAAIIATIYVEVGDWTPKRESMELAISESRPEGGTDYRGAGFIQITHLSNYRMFSEFSGVDVVSDPDKLMDPMLSAKSSVWYWIGGAGNESIVPYASRKDWDNCRSIVNAGSPGRIGICHGVPEFMFVIERLMQTLPGGADPSVMGVTPDPSAIGSGCIDNGGGGSSTHNVGGASSQGDVLAKALGLALSERMNEYEIRMEIDVASKPEVMDLEPGTTFQVTGFGGTVDGEYTCKSIEFFFAESLIAFIYGVHPDPNAPNPQVFLGDPDSGLTPESGPAVPGQVQFSGDGKILEVPYLSQLDNNLNPTGSCNVTSIAMCLKAVGIEVTPDELYQEMESTGLIRHSPQDLQVISERRGATNDLTVSGTPQDLKDAIDTGKPCAIHGYFTSSGHIIVVIGYDEDGFVVHDPYGQYIHPMSYDTTKSGQGLNYSYSVMDETCFTEPGWIHRISRG